MQQRNVFLVGILVIVLLISVSTSAAQGGTIPFPADAADAFLLFPDVIQDAPANTGTLQQRYILLAKAGNILSVTATMSEPGVVTLLELKDASGATLGQGVADPAAPETVNLSYEAGAEGWYYVNVNVSAPISATSFYSLALTGTTRAVYEVLGLEPLAAIPGAHLVAATAQINGELEETAMPFLFPLAEGDALAVTAQGDSQPRFQITTYSAAGAAAQTLIAEAPQAGGPVTYSFMSDKAQWLRIDVEPTMPGTFMMTATLPRISGTVANLAQGAGVSMTGSTGTTGSTTTAASGEMCGGKPAMLAAGDIAVITVAGDNLMIMENYTSGSASLGMALTGDLLEVVGAPECYTSPDYGRDLWYYNVFSDKLGTSGWVVGSLGTENWVCNSNDPACLGGDATCNLPHAEAVPGETLVVSEAGDDLLILPQPGVTTGALGLAGTSDEFSIVAGPTCVNADWYGGGLWYWNVFSAEQGISGWVVDGIAGEPWVCPASNPTCDK